MTIGQRISKMYNDPKKHLSAVEYLSYWYWFYKMYPIEDEL